MHVSIELAYFGVCVLVSGVVFLLVGLWYVLPRLSTLTLPAALTPLLLFSAFRVNGLFFLVPGVASPDIPKGFALPTAYGDATSAILAVVAVVALRYRPSAGIALAWTYGIVGSLDLLFDFTQVVIQGVMPADFAGTWILPTINVPALLVAHLLLFALLLRTRKPQPSERKGGSSL
jgi:hypothetical protein